MKTPGCQASSADGYSHSIEHKGVGSRGYADVDCPYAQAISNAIGIGIAIEVPVYTDGPKKWIFSQPEARALSLSKLLEAGADDAYRDIGANGTHTESVRCTDVIYLSLDGDHFQSYVYKARVDHRTRLLLAVSLRQEIDAQREREQQRREQQTKEQQTKEQQIRERKEREDEEWPIDKDAQLALETHYKDVRRVTQENEDRKLAQRLSEQERERMAFGATRPQRNRAFVSHVLRAARSTRFRY